MAGNPATSGARFDRWASTYDASPLQPALFAPVHQTTLQPAQQHLPDARRVLDVGCGTGQLLRQARQRYPRADLVGIDLAREMLAAAIKATTTELGVHYLHAGAERLPFIDEVFDLVFATMSLRHWTDQAAGIAEIGRVLTPGGVLVLADVFPSSPRQTLTESLLLRRRRPRLPGQLHAALTAHRLVVVGYDHTPGSACPMLKSSRRNGRAQTGPPSREWSGRAEWGRFARFPPSAGRHRQLSARVGPRCSEQ